MAVLSNPKHEAVAQGIIADVERNGPRAYRAVYPKASPHAAETAFGRLLRKVEFSSRIAELEALLAEQAAAAGLMSAKEVLQELSSIGRANMADYMDVGSEGDPRLHFSELSREQSAALQEVTVETFMDGAGDDARGVKRVRFKLHDKRGALVDLGRHYGLFKDRIEQTGKNGGPIERIERVIVDPQNQDAAGVRPAAGAGEI